MPAYIGGWWGVGVCLCALHQLAPSLVVGVDGYSGVPQGTAPSPVGSRPIAISPPTRVLISPFDWLSYNAAEVNSERCVKCAAL